MKTLTLEQSTMTENLFRGRMVGGFFRTRLLVLVIAGTLTGACATVHDREREPSTGPTEPAKPTVLKKAEQPLIEAGQERRETEAQYQEYLRRLKEKEKSAREEEKKAEEARNTEKRLLEEKKVKEEQLRALNERLALRRLARSVHDEDIREQTEAERDAEKYMRSLDGWKKDAILLRREDLREEAEFERSRSNFLDQARREREYRDRRLLRADPDRKRFYRIDSEQLFPRRFEIVAENGLRLFKNRKPGQFMAFRKRQTVKREVVPVEFPGGSGPVRLHLLEFLKGRPGNFILLDQNGAPVKIHRGGQNYQVVNIHTDGDVLLIVDLEREDLAEYHRVSVEAVDILFE